MACREAKGVAGVLSKGFRGLLLVPGQFVPRRSAWTGTGLLLGHYVLGWLQLSIKMINRRCLLYFCAYQQCPRHNACPERGVSSTKVCVYLVRDDVHASVADWL